jgi:hypothetical protein
MSGLEGAVEVRYDLVGESCVVFATTARLTCCVVGQPLLPRINLCGAHSAELRRHQVGLGS